MYTIKANIILRAPLDEVWDFFSSPKNLEKITPPGMRFDIMTGGEGKMYPGHIISYRLSPIPGIRMTWVTEITHVEEGKFFVDEQRIGPYKMWHHEHHFKVVPDGIEMTDIVSYAIPLGILGKLAHFLYVGKKVKSIFEYRSEVIHKYFKTV